MHAILQPESRTFIMFLLPLCSKGLGSEVEAVVGSS